MMNKSMQPHECLKNKLSILITPQRLLLWYNCQVQEGLTVIMSISGNLHSWSVGYQVYT